MESRLCIPTNSERDCFISISSPSPSLSSDDSLGLHDGGFPRAPPLPFLRRAARTVARSYWFKFLRRVFHYQNGPRSDLGSNPFNSSFCLVSEFVLLAIQITAITYVLSVSMNERPIWYLRVWIVVYDIGSLLSLPLLYWRYRHRHASHGRRPGSSTDMEQLGNNEENRGSQLINKSRVCLELFFAIWFVMGNVWVLDSRVRSFNVAPKLQALCLSLLAWNVVSYSFPFLLFVFLCCVVPLVTSLSGYNMNQDFMESGASDDQIARLPNWKFKKAVDEAPECCICLVGYKEKDQVRQLQCAHLFHQRCVDQWLRIIPCCPLCKQELAK